MLKQNQSSKNVAANVSEANTEGKALLVYENNGIWIIDIGATNHMVSRIAMLTKESVIKTKDPKPVYLPNA